MKSFELDSTPGHLIRRVAQVHKALWAANVTSNLTSPQYAVLVALAREPNINQRTLGERVSLDRSTTADVVARLDSRKLIARVRDPLDGRRNLLGLSDEGSALLTTASASVLVVRQMLMEALSPSESEEFVKLLSKILQHFDDAGTLVLGDDSAD